MNWTYLYLVNKHHLDVCYWDFNYCFFNILFFDLGQGTSTATISSHHSSVGPAGQVTDPRGSGVIANPLSPPSISAGSSRISECLKGVWNGLCKGTFTSAVFCQGLGSAV